MKKYLKEYINELESIIKTKEKISKEDIKNIETKINWFQHERLIHLLVTITYVIFTLIFMGLAFISYIFLIPFFIGIIFLLFYIPHYFFLEKGVQYLYKLYDKLNNKK